jgi:hypothetical protein
MYQSQKKNNINKKDFMKILKGKTDETDSIDLTNESVSEDLRMTQWKPQEIIKYANNVQYDTYIIKSNIAMRGAEHRKNKSRSKKDKHQKGLKQRVVQRKNAERRIKNHKFAFTDNISIEYDKMKNMNMT